MKSKFAITLTLLWMVAACSEETSAPAQPQRFEATPEVAATAENPPIGIATEATRQANAAMAARLPLASQTDFENANRGFLAKLEEPILNEDGSVSWDVNRFDFIKGDAPDTVNPSLWRQSKLNRIHGLFEVIDGIYQIRGYDLAVMTLIRGDTGWIIVDPLTSPAPAKAGLALANKTLGERPVVGVIFTHSHADHFGGVRGIISEADLEGGAVPLIAPAGFTEEAISENLLAGNYMARRAAFQFGGLLPAGETGQVGTGLGQMLSVGNVGLMKPTKEIGSEGETLTVDGVTLEFLDAGGTEAPAEIVFYLPQFKALCAAEVATRNFHNALTPRGAQIRDTLTWSKVIDQMLITFGAKSDVMFASHHWPIWEQENITTALRNQRDNYRYVHDQTLRRANNGGTMVEIAEELAEPDFAASDFGVRGYYGTLNHNSKAVFQYYFGWWDGVPANYHRLPPVEEAIKYVEFMGGADAVIEKSVASFNKGEFRWAATALNHLVFAEPGNKKAISWLAASYEQMGFQAESGAWRNYFLAGAAELRNGVPDTGEIRTGNPQLLRAVPTEKLFDAIAVRFNPEKMERDPYTVQFVFPDRDEVISIDVNKSVAFPHLVAADNPNATVTMDRKTFDLILAGETSFLAQVTTGNASVAGNPLVARAFMASLDQPGFWFNVVTP